MVDDDVVVLDAEDLDTGAPLVEQVAHVRERVQAPVQEPVQAVAVVAVQAQAAAAEPQPKKRKTSLQGWVIRNK
jgi:hypothetical protein